MNKHNKWFLIKFFSHLHCSFFSGRSTLELLSLGFCCIWRMQQELGLSHPEIPKNHEARILHIKPCAAQGRDSAVCREGAVAKWRAYTWAIIQHCKCFSTNLQLDLGHPPFRPAIWTKQLFTAGNYIDLDPDLIQKVRILKITRKTRLRTGCRTLGMILCDSRVLPDARKKFPCFGFVFVSGI